MTPWVTSHSTGLATNYIISDFFRVNQGVWCFCFKLSMFLKLSKKGVLEEGVGGQQATSLVAKQAVDFPQVLAI